MNEWTNCGSKFLAPRTNPGWHKQNKDSLEGYGAVHRTNIKTRESDFANKQQPRAARQVGPRPRLHHRNTLLRPPPLAPPLPGWCPWHRHHWPLAAAPLFSSATALPDPVTWLYSFKIQSPRQECPAGCLRVDDLPGSCQTAGESRYSSPSAKGHAATCFQMNLLQ